MLGRPGGTKTPITIYHKEDIMKDSVKFENVIEQVHNMSADNYDEIIPVKDIEFTSLEGAVVAGEPVAITPTCQRAISARLRIPYSYLSRCDGDLQQANLNFWLEREQEKRDTFFCRFSGNSLRGLFTDRYIPLDNMEVLSRMLQCGFNEQAEVHVLLDSEIMTLKFPDNDRYFKVSEKDRIIPGISISNSEIGLLALSIEAYYFRLVCSNGLIDKTEVNARYKHISRRIMDDFPHVLENVVYQSRQGQDRFKLSTQTPVDNAISTIELFSRQFQLPQEEAEIVKMAYFQEEGATMYHVINAFTRAAREPGLTAVTAQRLESIGGRVLNMVRR